MWRAFFGFSAMMLLIGLIAITMVRKWAPHRWADVRVKRAVQALPVVGIGALLLWGGARAIGAAMLADVLSALASLALLFEIALFLSMPIYALLRKLARAPKFEAEKPAESAPEPKPALDAPLAHTAAEPPPAPEPPKAEEPVTLTRRALLKSAAAMPIAAGTLAVGGVVTSRMTANVQEKPFFFEDLPPALDGMRILHLSDIHIGFSFSLRDLEAVLDEASQQSPDIVLVTGDLSDRIPELPDALSLIADLKPRYGAFASVGNHEYFRGIKDVRKAHDGSDVPMLLQANHTLDIQNDAGRAKLFLAGADDPRRMRGDLSGFLTNTVTEALAGRPDDAFTVLMSHRPKGFDAAAEAGVELTLSGHTHGGQMGFGGRSIFEPFAPEAYLWGHYTKGKSQLYTSSGVGHWFPFRVGCATEAPLIVLKRGTREA